MSDQDEIQKSLAEMVATNNECQELRRALEAALDTLEEDAIAQRSFWGVDDKHGIAGEAERVHALAKYALSLAGNAARAKEAKTCQCTNGVVRSVGRDNEEIIEDCPNCSPSKEDQP